MNSNSMKSVTRPRKNLSRRLPSAPPIKKPAPTLKRLLTQSNLFSSRIIHVMRTTVTIRARTVIIWPCPLPKLKAAPLLVTRLNCSNPGQSALVLDSSRFVRAQLLLTKSSIRQMLPTKNFSQLSGKVLRSCKVRLFCIVSLLSWSKTRRLMRSEF